MLDRSFDEVMAKLENIEESYFRLIFIVALAGKGKTALLQRLANHLNLPLLNLNREISQKMLDLTERQRRLKLPRLLEEIIVQKEEKIILLDNTELIFAPVLQQDPLRLLQRASRNKTIIASWNGEWKENQLIYASVDHPEYRKYKVEDFFVVVIGKE